MADNLYFQVQRDFDLAALVDHVSKRLQINGYLVRVYPLGNGAFTLSAERNTGGLSTVVGYCKAIKAGFILNSSGLMVSFSDEAWTDKIIGFAVGWFTCQIPWIFTAIGLYQQLQLPKIIENEIIAFTGTGPIPFGFAYGFGASNQTKTCSGCGAQINAAAGYCQYCGKKQ